MTEMDGSRRYRIVPSIRAAMVACAVTLVAVFGSGTASAAVDNENSIVDGGGNTVKVSQADTVINSVPSLDGSPLTREWFHNGRALFDVAGPDSAGFSGTLIIGYQVGYPSTLKGSLTFGYKTPGLSAGTDTDTLSPYVTLTDLLPQAGISLSVDPGPGVVEVEAAKGSVSGASGSIQLSNFHGTVTGVLGKVSIRPFVKLVSNKGDLVVTYGTPTVLN